jgi:two-component system sensor histidine kinase DctS
MKFGVVGKASSRVTEVPATQRRGLWALPLLLSIPFAAGVAVWVYTNDQAEREQANKTMVSAALSVEAQLKARIEAESSYLRVVAAQLKRGPDDTNTLLSNADVTAGIRRLWLSVTWIDSNKRIVAHIPSDSPTPVVGQPELDDETGLSLHLVAPVPEASAQPGREPGASGMVIVRYSPAVLLKRGVPSWISRDYDVQLVDTFDEIIATVGDGVRRGTGPNYRVRLEVPTMVDLYVRLTLREAVEGWYRALPMVLISGFLVLLFGATALLRRQAGRVSRAEAAWQTEAAWRSAMEDSALVGLRARDLEGRLIFVNRTFCDMVGYPADQLLGHAPPMAYWPADAIDEAMQRHLRNLAGQAPRTGYAARWQHANGSMLDVTVYESPLVNADGAHIGWMGSIIDVTQTRRLEERERRRTEVAAHHARLTMLGEVASTLAHELNQPLTAISSYTAGIANSVKKHAAPDAIVLSALDRLAAQTSRAGRIVQRIREFLTRRAPHHEACKLNEVIEQAAALLHRELERNEVELVMKLDPELPTVLADPVLIEQVVVNLLRNATDALAERPVPRTVEVSSVAVSHDIVRLTVADNGPGLQGRSVDVLCEAFYSTKPEGMGMGLAICRSIVEVHHGVFDAQEAQQGGARFSLSLPVNGPIQEEALS